MDGYTPRTYGDAFADVYDDWYEGVGDAEAAVRAITRLARGGAVLELGVGSGRLAVPLAGAGVPVWGLDASPAMLERLAQRPGGERVHAVLGDMAAAADALGADASRFQVVVAAFNTFFLVPSEDGQRACLRSVASVLAPGGVVVLECYVPGEPPASVERVLEPSTVAVDHVVLTATEHEPSMQVVRGQHIELRDGGIRLRPWMLRYATPAQLDALADDAGLRLVERWGAWDGRPPSDADAMHVSLYGER